MDRNYRFAKDERYPVEQLIFKIDPAHQEEFLKVDHEVWTLGEALHPAWNRVPFLSKEVWINENRPGIIEVVLVWESMEAWRSVDAEEIQSGLIALFDSKFKHPYKLLRAIQNEENFGKYRVNRFERA